jgi:hypothetical protein
LYRGTRCELRNPGHPAGLFAVDVIFWFERGNLGGYLTYVTYWIECLDAPDAGFPRYQGFPEVISIAADGGKNPNTADDNFFFI